jgi:two-component system clock-associated histidine kinase SasA
VHELKTPLTPILSSSELLVDELSEEPLKSVAKNIYRGAGNLNNRINELLDLAKFEIGSLTISRKKVNADRLIRDTAEEMAALIDKYHQHLFLNIADNLPEIWADEERLHQIILNLLVNASKFTPEGGSITLSSWSDGNVLLVEVRDTGKGMSRKEQERVFEPYQRRIDDRERFSGLGLGLSLCKTLVELHGGKIWVDSQEGEGATFTFSIPLVSPAQTQANRSEEHA